ncbi:hypothetical protein Adt_39711 [Abeliophyllum distichum]|uniref:Uncharacterized protein n=1 Tax=Abeliophyllum distichum TaxID=126358 RepID=A0ABD1Q5V5_9LAMI
MAKVVGDALSEPIVSPSVEIAGDASSDLSSMSVVPVLVETLGDSSPSPFWERGTCSSGRCSLGGGAVNSSTSILSQDKGEEDIRSCKVGPKGAPKRELPEEGAGVDSGRVKKSRMAPPKETSGSN